MTLMYGKMDKIFRLRIFDFMYENFCVTKSETKQNIMLTALLMTMLC